MNKNQKGFSAVALIIIAGVLVFAGAFAFRYFASQEKSNVFELSKMKIGDEIAGLKIVSIKPFIKENQYKNFPGAALLPPESNTIIQFFGKATISGVYSGGDEVVTVNVLTLDEQSRLKLPALQSSSPEVGPLYIKAIAFPSEEVRLNFKKGGIATVVIENLHYVSYPADFGIPYAKLVEILENQENP